MLTRLLENIDPLPDDPIILHSLDFDLQEREPVGNVCPMGIRNADGRVYRLVQTQGVGETVRLIRTLQKLGFTEEDCGSPTEGCNSTFRRRSKTQH
ncbi:MAG: hypothetical protein H6930_14525 [Rhodoferax sp.]|jgi:hypothetical protein|nr:hypothetical protein [Rhodoferax sp.]